MVVAQHELPEQIVERLMLERILRRGNAKRDMIQTGKGPGITNPTRQKRDHRWCLILFGQGRAIAESDFHVGSRKRSSQLLGDSAVGAICSYQHLTVPLSSPGTTRAAQCPARFSLLNSARSNFFKEHFSAGFTGAVTQIRVKRDARINCE